MPKAAHFKVDPRLASLLGEGYRSSEEALKELVDNAWDADATTVRITLPRELAADPIVIEDDGAGMTERELREEYLVVANDRRSRKGDRTASKNRPVKGRKGIGKFAGLMAAEAMQVETRARGVLTRVRITKTDLLPAGSPAKDLEAIDLPIQTGVCDSSEHGTKITLSNLNQSLAFPSAEKLRQILVMDYGRQSGFNVIVNGEPVAIEDIPGTTISEEIQIEGVGPVRVKFTISEGKKPLKQHGLVFRVGGKIVGRPTMLGLEDDETIPTKLLKRVYGEIEADGLADEVTADWGAIVENSKGLQNVRQWAASQVKGNVEKTFSREVNLAKARLQKEAKRRLAQLPEHRRRLAEEAIERILKRFYAESEERIDAVVSIALEAFESDEYWIVLQSIDDATRADVARLAEVLDEFGLVDVAMVAQQTRRRLAFLDELDQLVGNAATLEAQLHKAIENNLWVLGLDFAMISSNKTLAQLVRQWVDQEFVGERASKRPDLFLAQDTKQHYVLIEFKRPSHKITRDDEAQAIKYRDDLSRFVSRPIDILVMGGPRDPAASPMYGTPGLRVTTYFETVGSARTQLEWLLSQLGMAKVA